MAKVEKKLSKEERNFWIEGVIDGNRTILKAGPTTKDGGFILNIFQRDRGKLIKVATIEGKYDPHQGTCNLEMYEVREYEGGGGSRVDAHSITTQKEYIL